MLNKKENVKRDEREKEKQKKIQITRQLVRVTAIWYPSMDTRSRNKLDELR